MKKVFFLLICSLFSGLLSNAQSNRITLENYNKLNSTHDIFLSPWGPYSKKYAGISHLADMHSGLRFDFSVLPGLYRNKILIPNVLMESGYYPWEANDDLTRYTYRYELEWKDRTYADVTYHVIDSSTALVVMRCVNNSDLPRELDLNLMASVDYPENYPSRAVLPAGDALWKNAVEYGSLKFAGQRPTDDLVNNGWLRGEVRDSEYIDGRAIAQHFGRDKGDQATYQLNINRDREKGNLAILYRMKAGTQGTFNLSGMVNQAVTLSGTGRFEWKIIPYALSGYGVQSLTLASEGGSEITLNGLLITSPDRESAPPIIPLSKHWEPERTENISPRAVILKYKDIPAYYGIAWDQDCFKIREVKNDELDIFFRKLVTDRLHTVFTGNNKGDYADVYIGPLTLDAHDVKTAYALLCTGSYEAVKKRLAGLNALKANDSQNKGTLASTGGILPEGEKYEFSQQLLRATLMTNIVYPIYTQNSYIRHFTPGKWWNSIYTWDVGLIALGLNEINPDLAAECINAYTTPVGSQSAFVHHGSPVPTQIYAFYDLWNKTQSREMQAYFYPRLKQYYQFLAGRLGSSTTRKLKSNILSTWDYFYNSGGWDDYPPQVAVHLQNAEQKVAPVVTTAQCIRVAKMMRMAATYLHQEEDIRMYDQDIRDFSNALQRYAWDSAAGYFSYVVHNKEGYPVGHFKDSGGIDYNMGLDGAYPLLSGICTPVQQKELIEKIFSSTHMWTPAGISVVDQSAPYYSIDGYWNGTVWMPHQWFIWKTMLDIGRPDLAFRIAEKALDVYKMETDASYSTFEHFFSKTGRGAGWHQFSGLSSPILSWFSAYYKIGTVTPGFEIWINDQTFNADTSSYKADISFDQATPAHSRSMLVCMNPFHRYLATFNGKRLPVNSPYNGLLQITLPVSNQEGMLIIKPEDL